jgi:hypothetical protein
METPPELPPKETYSAESINAALSDFPAELAQGIVNKLARSAGEAKQAKEVENVQLNAAALAVAAHQNYQKDTPDMLDVITWDRWTRDCSENVLHYYGNLPVELRTAIPDSVVDFATCFYVQRQVNFGETDDELEELLAPAGVTLSAMYDRLANLVFESHFFGDVTLEKIRQRFAGLNALAYNMHEEVIAPLAKVMREELIAIGYRLPELGPDNTYGYDEEEEEYITPDITPELLPRKV